MADEQTDPTDDRQAEATEPAAGDSGPTASSEADEKVPAKTSGPAERSGATKGPGPGKKSGAAKSSGASAKAGGTSQSSGAGRDAAGKGADGEGAAEGDDATPKVVRKKVTSKRVTPKGGAQGAKVTSSPVSEKNKARWSDEDDEPGFSKRYTPPQGSYADGPSPMWVPVLMFALLIVGALVIMLNYMEVFGEPSNIRLVIGLGFILGGIITATQYR